MKSRNQSVLFFWIILGMVLIVTQVQQPVLAQCFDVEQAANDDSDSAETIISIGQDIAINSATGLSLNQEFYKIREIYLDEVADPHIVHVAQKLTETDHFKTLFRKVISANAP